MYTGAGQTLTQYLLEFMGFDTTAFPDFMAVHPQYSRQLKVKEVSEHDDLTACLCFIKESKRIGLINSADFLSLKKGVPELLEEARSVGMRDPKVIEIAKSLSELMYATMRNWIDYDINPNWLPISYQNRVKLKEPDDFTSHTVHGIRAPYRIEGQDACAILSTIHTQGSIALMEQIRSNFGDISNWLSTLSRVNPSFALFIQGLGALSLFISKSIALKFSQLPLGSIQDYFCPGARLNQQRLKQVIQGKRILTLGLLSTIFFRLYSLIETSGYFSSIGVLSDAAFGYIYTLMFILLSFAFPSELSLVEIFIDWYSAFQDERKRGWEKELYETIKDNLTIFGTNITFGQYTAIPDNFAIDVQFSLGMIDNPFVPIRREVNEILINSCARKKLSFRIAPHNSYFLVISQNTRANDLVTLSEEIENSLLDIVVSRVTDGQNKAELDKLMICESQRAFFDEYDELERETIREQRKREIARESHPGAVSVLKLTVRQKSMARALVKTLSSSVAHDRMLVGGARSVSIHYWNIPACVQKFLSAPCILSSHENLIKTISAPDYAVVSPKLGFLSDCNEKEVASELSKLDRFKFSRLLEKRLASNSGGEGVKRINHNFSISGYNHRMFEFKYDADSQYRIYGMELNSRENQAKLIIFCVIAKALHSHNSRVILDNVIAAINNQFPVCLIDFSQPT